MKDDLIEAVARAMCARPDECVMGSGGISTDASGAVMVETACYRRAWQDQVGNATAAVNAILERLKTPSDEMLRAGKTLWSSRSVWQAMLNEIK